MNDRELLELAAKAAGFDLTYCHAWSCMAKKLTDLDGEYFDNNTCWNPLSDDGDALRLAVRLRIMLNREINFGCDIVEAIGPEDDDMSRHCSTESIEGDPYAATRRAIVRAAAEIGRQMQEGGAA